MPTEIAPANDGCSTTQGTFWTMMARPSMRGAGMTKQEKFVIFASSLGTIFEWYDFYLYATLAPFFAALFFPPGNDTAALLSAFATYAAGFLIRPAGALVFGRIGDLVGRKYTFLITIMVMGGATFLVGLLPTFSAIGWIAPFLLVALRLVQGLALGGEYGGAATYVAEHARPAHRGFSTSFVQTTATLGFFLALLIISFCRLYMDEASFAQWGWRIPFLVSVILLVFSVYIRLRLNETPIFQKMKEEGKGSKAPLTESFFRYPNNKYVLLALLGATAGQGVIWYTGQFYALFFLQITLRLDFILAYALVAVSLVVGTPLFIFFGWLSDRIGRLKIILAGCLIAAATYFPLFKALTEYVHPDLVAFQAQNAITVAADASTCEFHIFVGPWSSFSECDRAQDFVTRLGVSFKKENTPGKPVALSIGSTRIEGWDAAKWQDAFNAAG
ncbi:MAG: MFS transporter, partial [Rhodoplanes sp.]